MKGDSEAQKEDFSRKVELIGVLAHPGGKDWKPGDYAVAGALGCTSGLSSTDIHQTHRIEGGPYEPRKGVSLDWGQTRELILGETSGRGHGAVLDQEETVFSLDNVSRATTLFLCGPPYGSHLQKSLRRATAERAFVSSGDKEGDSLMRRQFELYGKLASGGVPKEDARIILPLHTKTAIQTKWNARELMHLKSLSERCGVPRDVRETIDEMYAAAAGVAPDLMMDRGNNFEVLAWMPSPALFVDENSALEKVARGYNDVALLGFSRGLKLSREEVQRAVKGRDEGLLSALKHYHFTFAVPMSLMSLHQATRQRTWDQSFEPLNSAIRRGGYVTPPKIAGTEFEREFRYLMEESIAYARRNLENPEATAVVPHAVEVMDVVHINGWNAIHSIGKRTCKKAQWEIRGKARMMAREIKREAPEMEGLAVPQGIIYGTCPERKSCGICQKPEEK